MSTTAGSPPQEMPQDSTASPAPRSGKRLILVLLGLVVLVLAGIWLARWWTVGRFIESTDDAYLQADSVTVAPKVTLFGDLGFSASDPGHLARQSNFSWIGVPYLQWNVLDFGRTPGSVHAAEASPPEAQP